MPPRTKNKIQQRLEEARPAAMDALADVRTLSYEEMVAAGFRDPRVMLPSWGHIINQRNGEPMRYDPDYMCPRLHNTMLHWAGEEPRTAIGHRMWFLELGPRQSGKSTLASLIVDNMTAYKEGANSIIMAKDDNLTKELFQAIKRNHDLRDPLIRPRTANLGEINQLTYHHGRIASRIKVLPAGSTDAGVGRSVDNMQMSEVPFYKDFPALWSGLRPAIINREEMVLIVESTPAPMDRPSAEAYKELCANVRMSDASGEDRFIFHFTPFYASRLNMRPWRDDWTLEIEEQRLLDKYGPAAMGYPAASHISLLHPFEARETRFLTLQHLAFRRETLASDKLLRTHPEQFFTWYPVDPVSCWSVLGSSVIPSSVLDRHRNKILTAWSPVEELGRLQVYREPRPGAVYVLCADPAGWGQDHAVFHILEVWTDQVIQAATFASRNVEPHEFARAIVRWARKYNDALVVVERNGVGTATAAILREEEDRGNVRNLYYENSGIDAAPGIHAGAANKNEALGQLIMALRHTLVLNDAETVDQLGSYRHDKLVEESSAKQIIRPEDIGKGRRPKHHWDRVSALMWGIWALKAVPARIRPAWVDTGEVAGEPTSSAYNIEGAVQTNLIKDLSELSYSEVSAYRKALANINKAKERHDRRVGKRAAARAGGRRF